MNAEVGGIVLGRISSWAFLREIEPEFEADALIKPGIDGSASEQAEFPVAAGIVAMNLAHVKSKCRF